MISPLVKMVIEMELALIVSRRCSLVAVRDGSRGEAADDAATLWLEI